MKPWLFPLVQTIFVAVLVISFYAASWVGEQYVLRAEPFDPFDPFYGEYVMLQYPDLDSPDSLPTGEVYFTLRQGEDGYAVIDRIDDRPFFGAIAGTNFGEHITAPQLEQFYVEQGTGPSLEAVRELQVTVDVAPWGIIRPVKLEERSQE